MKKIEFILIAVALLCVAVLLTDHWTGVLIAPTGITLLAVFYFMSGFFLFCGLSFSAVFHNFSYTRHSAHDLLFAAAGGIAVAFLLVGIQSKLMLWSFSDLLLKYTFITVAALCISALIIYKRLSPLLFKRVMLRVGIYTGIGLTLYSISGPTLIAHYFRNDIEIAQTRHALWIDPYNDMLENRLERAISYRENQENGHSRNDDLRLFP